MSQSALTVGLLAAAFVLYLAARGRLTTYTGVLYGAKPKASGASGSGGGSSGVGDYLATAAKYAPEIAAAFG